MGLMFSPRSLEGKLAGLMFAPRSLEGLPNQPLSVVSPWRADSITVALRIRAATVTEFREEA